MPDKFITLKDTQKVVKATLGIISSAVLSTMGPNGKLSLIGVGTANKVTKDGVTVARSIKFENPFMEHVSRLITEASLKTDEECGDGTTTTILFTSFLYGLLSEHQSFRDQRFIEFLIDELIVRLENGSIQVNRDSEILTSLALTTSNDDKDLANKVLEIYRRNPDKFPTIELEEGSTNVDVVKYSKGLPLKLSFSNSGFSASGMGEETTYLGRTIIVIDSNVKANQELQLRNALNELPKVEGGYLLIARSFDNEINNLIYRFFNGESRYIVPLQTNMGGSVGTQLMQDLAVALNANLLQGIEEIPHREHLVCKDELTVSGNRATLKILNNDTKNRIDSHIEEIKKTIVSLGGGKYNQRTKFNEQRIRDLSGELVTILVGGETSSDIRERIDRFEDVVKAVKSALINGVLPGVGIGVKRAVEGLTDVLGKDSNLSASEEEILSKFKSIFQEQVKFLMEDISEVDIEEDKVMNLATGEIGTPEEIGVYDTAYASSTALKGGFKTALILSNLNSILIGDKLGAVSIK